MCVYTKEEEEGGEVFGLEDCSSKWSIAEVVKVQIDC